MNQAALQATEIEAQFVLQLQLATWHRASQDSDEERLQQEELRDI